MKAVGKNGSMELTEHSVIISRKDAGMNTSLLLIGQGDKSIDIGSITAIQFKEPGILAGHLRLSINGRDDTRPFADGDENAVMFGSKNLADFEQLRDALSMRLKERNAPPQKAETSLVSEIERLADLHERGALSDAEFASAKSKLLGE